MKDRSDRKTSPTSTRPRSDWRGAGNRGPQALSVRDHGPRQPCGHDAHGSQKRRAGGGGEGRPRRAVGSERRSRPPSGHGGLPAGRAGSRQRDPRAGRVPGGTAGSRRFENRPHVGAHLRAVPTNPQRGRCCDRVHALGRRGSRPRGRHPAGGRSGRRRIVGSGPLWICPVAPCRMPSKSPRSRRWR